MGDDQKAHFIPHGDERSESVIAAARSGPNFAISVLRNGRELA